MVDRSMVLYVFVDFRGLYYSENKLQSITKVDSFVMKASLKCRVSFCTLFRYFRDCDVRCLINYRIELVHYSINYSKNTI